MCRENFATNLGEPVINTSILVEMSIAKLRSICCHSMDKCFQFDHVTCALHRHSLIYKGSLLETNVDYNEYE